MRWFYRGMSRIEAVGVGVGLGGSEWGKIRDLWCYGFCEGRWFRERTSCACGV